ncbi:MAG: FecR domain-containing protein [Alkalispirochaetaceae bacterium]
MHITSLIPPGVITVLAWLLLPATLLSAGGSDEQLAGGAAEVTGGRIDYLEGEVTVNGETAEIGTPVATGDLLVTGAASVADVVFGGQNIFRLDEQTSAHLTLDPGRQGVRLERGAFAAVFDELVTVGDEEESRFLLETRHTVAGVRGTTFFVKVESEDATFVCTCHGSLRLDPRSGASPFTVTNYRHEAYRFRSSGDQAVVETEADLYHTTEELNRLAERIGVTIPWGEAPPR